MNRDSLISLRNALNFAEEELGLNKLSELEKKLYYAALDCSDTFGHFSSEVIRNSKWCKDIPHATYHRTLANLVTNGIISKVSDRKRNLYSLPSG